MSTSTYQAAVLTAPGTFTFTSQPLTPPGPGEVRIRVEGCGVCGSNLPVWEGRPWFNYPLEPGAPGHEGWGIVDAVGPEVSGVRVGERVASLSLHAFAEYALCPASSVVPLPTSADGHPFPGEALGCAMNVFKRCDIQPGHNVAVVGLGFLGLLLTQLAVRAGATTFALSRRSFPREIATRLGASATFSTEDALGAINEIRHRTRGLGCERVIEATGLQGPLDLAGELVAESGRLIIAGYHQDGLRQVNMQQWNWRGIDVINAHERDPRKYTEGIRDAAAAVGEGRLDPDSLYTHVVPLSRISEAFREMQSRPAGFLKALVTT